VGVSVSDDVAEDEDVMEGVSDGDNVIEGVVEDV